MTENLLLLEGSASREEKYRHLLPQVKALVSGENDLVAKMANISAALKQTFDFFWVGFYIVKGKELVLGPFQGPVACTRIKFGKGVCGKAWKDEMPIVVPDVEDFPGHIACNSESKSEIVVPVLKQKEVVAVLDVDSDSLNDFGNTDAFYLGKITDLLFEN
ncbi:MAG: GAF domain-containing protein [Dysgonamonadaceae bacterium]|jgi:GAF domain-containing protein|nr:GAF domain-containing protein [Dysgonamonadaceae bacterium]